MICTPGGGWKSKVEINCDSRNSDEPRTYTKPILGLIYKCQSPFLF